MLKLGKVFFSTLIIYILWFKEAFGNYPVILYGTFMAGFRDGLSSGDKS